MKSYQSGLLPFLLLFCYVTTRVKFILEYCALGLSVMLRNSIKNSFKPLLCVILPR